ncbi:hypothetical protein [Thermocrinis ruber]|uniref:hypothetical protein n=1 Tax=Thermocrinis ruber TaxID=75906 RepID=UPI0012EC8304|nr:hypothetical protein [Thermocrinis ruber]
MRVLVFTLLFVLGLFAYSQEILKGSAKDHKKLFIYSLRGGDGSVIRIDLVNVNQDVGISLIVGEVSLEMIHL